VPLGLARGRQRFGQWSEEDQLFLLEQVQPEMLLMEVDV
jgi:hypothetical protein